MQRTVESANPVLRKRTPKVSIALATVQESNWRNFSSTAGSNGFEVIGSPDLKIAYKFREHQGRIHARRHFNGAASSRAVYCPAQKSDSPPRTIRSALIFQREFL